MIRNKFGQQERRSLRLRYRENRLAIVGIVVTTAIITAHLCNETTEITVNNYGGAVTK